MKYYAAFVSRVLELSNFSVKPLNQMRIHPSDYEAVLAELDASRVLKFAAESDSIFLHDIRLILDETAKRLEISQ